jgi:3-oxoacyl-[acyl-carrier-protein] synthase III
MSFAPTRERALPTATRQTASVLGLGHHLPHDIVPNGSIADRIGVDHDWIVKRTGIRSRRRAAPNAAPQVAHALHADRAGAIDVGGHNVVLCLEAATTSDD